jgi:hypothetical protein
VTITHGTGSSITFNVQDLNGNPIAAGSTIAVTADSAVGTINSLTGSVTMGCSTAVGGNNFTTNLAAATTFPASGNIYITVTSPGTKTITGVFFPVTIN